LVLSTIIFKEVFSTGGRKVMSKLEQTPIYSSDESIIDMYWARNPDAIQETDHKYGLLLRKIAYNILFDTLDCEECQNDTYLDIWNSIPTARPSTFLAFIVKIMRRTAIDRYRLKTRDKRIPSQLTISIQDLEQTISNGPSIEEIYEAKEIGKMISDYISTLSPRKRYIFIDRYYLAEPVERIASDLCISVKTVYKEIGKIKQGLKEYLLKNGVCV
jgi:RNA polymerase sigma-70 factor (ECF subfamily)